MSMIDAGLEGEGLLHRCRIEQRPREHEHVHQLMRAAEQVDDRGDCQAV